MLRSYLKIIEHFYSNENFVILILLVQRHLSGTISIKKDRTLRSNFLRSRCINIDRRKDINFLGTRLMGDKYSDHYCRTQERCPGSFIQCIFDYFHLQKKCPLHQPRKNLSGFKTRLIDVYFHVLTSLEITFYSDYLFSVLNYTVYREKPL